MTFQDIVKLILTFLGAAATPIAALPDNMVPVYVKIGCVALGGACIATIAQMDKIGHRHPSVSGDAPDASPFEANDVPVTKPKRARRKTKAVLTEPVVAAPSGKG